MPENKKITIVVHSGNFHVDDIFAVATLQIMLGKDTEVSVVRTRDMHEVEKSDYVVDVGWVYDPVRKRFDHHQVGGAGARPNGIPYAAFGLVWKEYGEKICGNWKVAGKIDDFLVQTVDAVDNGVELSQEIIKGVHPYDIVNFFDAFNPDWPEKDQDEDVIFMQMVSIAKLLLEREIIKTKDKIKAREMVEKLYDTNPDKRLIIMDQGYSFQETLSKYPEPLFAVFPRDEIIWLIHTIRDDANTFKSRKDLPKSWAGKRDKELEEATGVVGANFCHPGRFIAGAETKEAILKMAEIALNS